MIEALDQLRAGARSGQFIGIAFAVMEKSREYFVNAAGEARRNPTFSRGMVAALDDRLAQWVGSLPPP